MGGRNSCERQVRAEADADETRKARSRKTSSSRPLPTPCRASRAPNKTEAIIDDFLEAEESLAFKSPEDPFVPKKDLARTPPTRSEGSASPPHKTRAVGHVKKQTADVAVQVYSRARHSKDEVAKNQIARPHTKHERRQRSCLRVSCCSCSYLTVLIRRLFVSGICLILLPRLPRDWFLGQPVETSLSLHHPESHTANRSKEEVSLACTSLQEELQQVRAELLRCQTEGCRPVSPASSNLTAVDTADFDGRGNWLYAVIQMALVGLCALSKQVM
eukprot:TRINITY_DN14121_c0_g1_i1.p1 TRINITY_DN14121_c0_g1~~TRINITY_DN14121_c0_g1_i1.p1  ORF type:complete len:274 (+),score=33.16 TRINITY_DN14121_c0_g1_i1:43-864(+)